VTSAGLRRPTLTPPMSLLCSISSAASLTTTGYPSALAASAAAIGSAARTLGTTGIPCSAMKAEARYSDQEAAGSSDTVSGEGTEAGVGAAAVAASAVRCTCDQRTARPSAVSPWWMPPRTAGKPA